MRKLKSIRSLRLKQLRENFLSGPIVSAVYPYLNDSEWTGRESIPNEFTRRAFVSVPSGYVVPVAGKALYAYRGNSTLVNGPIGSITGTLLPLVLDLELDILSVRFSNPFSLGNTDARLRLAFATPDGAGGYSNAEWASESKLISISNIPVAPADADWSIAPATGGFAITIINPVNWRLRVGTLTYSIDGGVQSPVAINGETGIYFVANSSASALSVTLTATNANGTATSTAKTVTPGAGVTIPAFTAPPVISGTATEGQTATAGGFTYTGTEPITVSYQFRRGVTGVGTNSASYAWVAGDVGFAGSVDVTLTNSAGSVTASSAAVGPIASAGGLSIRQQIEGLRTNVTPNGRQTATALKVFGVDALPAGVTVSGKIVTMSGTGTVLDNWDMTDKRLNITGTDNVVTNNYWGPVEVVLSTGYPIALEATAVRSIIRYNTIDGFNGYGGPSVFIVVFGTGTGAENVGAQDWLIEYNRFLHCNSDIFKAAGNGLFQYNYMGPLTNYPAGTVAWAAGTTYADGQYALAAAGHLIVNKAAGNIGNVPPESRFNNGVVNGSAVLSTNYSGSATYAVGALVNNTTTYAVYRSLTAGNKGNALTNTSAWALEPSAYVTWVGLDPHGDAITVTGSDGKGCIIRRNLFDWDSTRIVQGVGTVQCTRIVRNTGTSVMMGPVTYEENLLSAPYKGRYAVAAGFIRDFISTFSYNLGDFCRVGTTYYRSLIAANEGFPPATSPAQWVATTDINAPGPIRFQNNWLPRGSSNLYFASMTDAVDVWSNNRDTLTDALVPGPVLRVSRTPLVASVIGQSENAVGFTLNTAYYTAGPYPVLLSGVDAQIASHAASDASGVATVHPLTAAAITARSVNPGFVGLANLWHLGSGGRPLRLVADVVSGTSMAAQMDDAVGDGREFSDSAALVSLAQSTWGASVTRVVYNWWNSEAAAAKTLWASRSGHFFGINSNGTNYDFTAGPIEHCLIDTTARGFGLLPGTAKLDLMLPGLRINNSTSLQSPPHLNYRTESSGAEIFGMIDQNAYEAYAARDNVLALAPSANRGAVTISPSLVRFGDYSGGVQLTGAAQTSIHPAMQHKDGQILFSQEVAANFLIAEGYAKVSTLLRVEQSTDRTTFDFVFDIPLGGVLTTQRILDAETVATPRPHQQQVMGFVVARGADTDRTMRPLYRTDNSDGTLYPVAYRGTATITNTGTNVGAGREAVVRVVLGQALAAGDKIHFGTDGGYGGFILHGWPDYDANLYRDGLRVYEARLSDGSATRYPGIPVRAQRIHTVLAGAADVSAPTLSGVSTTDTATTATLSWSTNEGNGTAYWMVDTNATRTAAQVIAGGGAASGSRAVTATGVQTAFAASGLIASTLYYFHLVHRDAALNSSTVSSTTFTTEAAGPSFAVVDNQAAAYSLLNTHNVSDPATKIVLAWRAKADNILASMRHWGNTNASWMFYYNTTSQLRWQVGGSSQIAGRTVTSVDTGMHTYALVIDVAQAAAADGQKLYIDGVAAVITSPSWIPSASYEMAIGATTGLHGAGGFSLFHNSGGLNILDGQMEFFWADWGGAGYTLPDFSDPTVWAKLSAGQIGANGQGVTGSAPKRFYTGTPAEWNAGLANKGTLTGALTKTAGTYV